MKDKVVVITGSSRGLGKAMAGAFAKQGAKLVVSAPDTPADLKELNAVAKEINGFVITADVRHEAEVMALANKTFEKFGQIDIWVNNAGIWLPRMPIENVDMGKARDLFDVNVFGCINGSRAALAVMKKRGSGTIVNIVSTAALAGRPYSLIYSATKHAEKGVTDSLREELKIEKSAIRVIGIYPGGMKTTLFNESKPDDFNEYMDVEPVAKQIIDNLLEKNPKEELVIKRPGQAI